MLEQTPIAVNEKVSHIAWVAQPLNQWVEAVLTADAPTGYIINAAPTNQIVYGFADVDAAVGTVRAVRVQALATATGTPNYLYATLTIGGVAQTRIKSAAISVYPSLTLYEFEWEGAWTRAQANAMTVKLEAECQIANNVYVDQLYAEIDYDLGQAAKPTATVMIALESETEGATIYYTTDGSEPTVESTEYTTPFEIADDCLVKSIAVAENYENSDVAGAQVEIIDGVTPRFVLWDDYPL